MKNILSQRPTVQTFRDMTIRELRAEARVYEQEYDRTGSKLDLKEAVAIRAEINRRLAGATK